jgi:hypothetical protein
MDPADIAALFYGDEASGPEKAQQLAAALRGDTQLGQLGMLTGDKVLGGVGQSLIQGAAAGQQQLEKAANMRLTKAMEAEKQKTEQEFRQSQERHMTEQERLARAQLDANRFKEGALGVIDSRTGKLTQYAKSGDGLKDQKEMNEELKELAKSINRDAGRGSLLPQAQNRLNASGRIKTSIVNPDGSIKNLSPELTAEAALNTAALLANGTPGEHTISMLLPKGRGMKQAEIQEWLDDSPHGAGQQKYLKALVDLANREEETIGGQIREAQLRQLPRFAPSFKKYGEPFWNAARGHIGADLRGLVDPETLLPLEKAAASAGGLTPQEAARLAELEKRHGAKK